MIPKEVVPNKQEKNRGRKKKTEINTTETAAEEVDTTEGTAEEMKPPTPPPDSTEILME